MESSKAWPLRFRGPAFKPREQAIGFKLASKQTLDSEKDLGFRKDLTLNRNPQTVTGSLKNLGRLDFKQGAPPKQIQRWGGGLGFRV